MAKLKKVIKIKKVPLQIKKFSCDYCGKALTTKSNLKKHVTTCNKVICVCNEVFATRQKLNKHKVK